MARQREEKRIRQRWVGRAGWAALLLSLAGPPAEALDDFQTWSTLAGQYLRRGHWSLGVGAELRLDDDSSSAWFGRLSHEARYRANERWVLDANLSAIRLRAGGDFDLDTLRLELAATPSWALGRRASFAVRNRVDLWLREGGADEEGVFRLLPRLNVRLGGEQGRHRLFFAAEGFWSESRSGLFQHRIYPIGASLPVGPRASLNLYVMVLSVDVAGGWRHDLVIGQSWSFRFSS